MPETAAIDEALVDLLQGDAALYTVMPDGVYWGAGPPHATRLVVVTRLGQVDAPTLGGGHAYEDIAYRIRAVALSTLPNANADARAAEARIEALLGGGTLAAPGYTLMVARRIAPLHETTADVADPAILWLERGGDYQVMMST
jgi:hypothetical protein